MVRLVVCDIDNTIVPKHKQPSEGTIRCIREFNKRGIMFGFASGRSTDMLRDLAKQWNVRCDILIGNNGGEYQDEITGEHDIFPKLTCEDLEEIFKIMEPFKDQVNVQMFVNDVRYVRRLDEATMESVRYRHMPMPVVVSDESVFWSRPAYKVGFRTPAEIMKDVEAEVAKHPSTRFKGFKTEFTMFEFTPVNCEKGDMLIRFCKSHNIPIKDAWAFGDMTNDISLIKEAGVGVCLENGSDDAKAVADIITEESIEDDGFAKFVEKHILNEN
ncbi:MAG: HAD-IIB family hydrolase [Erysipelotrichaceae bacterium]|nr:HAD-IIB family hydrolase [Erysipelotrichaceae bacterium]